MKKFERINKGIVNIDNYNFKDFFYADLENKLVFNFSPRAGCSSCFKIFLDLTNLLKEGEKYNSFIHHYRLDVIDKNVLITDIDKFLQSNFKFIKFITNPFKRAVSIFRLCDKNITFRKFSEKIAIGDFSNFNNSIVYHLGQQYFNNEENYIDEYIKIDKNETLELELKNGEKYLIDPNNYSSIHHAIIDQKNKLFCGDKELCMFDVGIIQNYNFFYDEKIYKNIYAFYKDDIEKYNYKF